MASIRIKRGTRAQLDAAAAASGLKVGEPYLITDENRIAVGLSTTTYEVYAKSSEVGGVTQYLDYPVQSSTPTAPSSGSIREFSESPANFDLLGWITPSSKVNYTQTRLATSRFVEWRGNAAFSTVTATGAGALTATGTLTSKTAGVSNFVDALIGVQVRQSTAGVNAVAGISLTTGYQLLGQTTNLGGFFYSGYWGPASGVTVPTHRAFFGLYTYNTVTDVDPSTLTSFFGMGYDSSDTNVQFMHSTAYVSPTTTKVDLGSGFPKPTNATDDAYELLMNSPPGLDKKVYWRVRHLRTNAIASGSFDCLTNIAVRPYGYLGIGGGASSQAGIYLYNLRIEFYQ